MGKKRMKQELNIFTLIKKVRFSYNILKTLVAKKD